MEGPLRRLRERKMFQWAIAYLAGAWLLLQVADLVGNRFGWPDSVLRALIALLAVGFLAALVIAWYHGERGHQRVTGTELLVLGGVLVLAATAVSVVTRMEPPSTAESDQAGLAEASRPGPQDPEYGASVAVLPFDDLGEPDGREYFSDAITEEIITELARIEGLKVISRTSVVSLRGTRLTMPQIADTLGVRHVLQGAVLRSGDRVRVTAHLIDPRSDTHLWTQTFEGTLTDIFSFQEEIAERVALALLNRLDEDRVRGAGSRTDQAAAYDAYLRGIVALQRHSPDRLAAAMTAFEEAIRLDSTFAPAYSSLGHAHVLWALFAYPGERDPYETSALALSMAARAVALDPSLAEAHAVLGHARLRAGAPPLVALRDLERAVQLAPGSMEVRRLHSVLLANAGRFEEAVRASELAVALDPLSPGSHDFLAVTLTFAGHYERALDEARRSRSLEPQFLNPRRQEARALLLLGRHEECVATEMEPFVAYRAMCLHSSGREEAADSIVRDLVAAFRGEGGGFPTTPGILAADLAEYYAWTGDPEEATAWLRRSAALWPLNLLIPRLSTFAPVRDDPDYIQALEEIREGIRIRVAASDG